MSRRPNRKREYWRNREPFAEATEKESRIWVDEALQARLGGISYAEAGDRLAKMADAVGWVVFRDKLGRVHAIGKPVQ